MIYFNTAQKIRLSSATEPCLVEQNSRSSTAPQCDIKARALASLSIPATQLDFPPKIIVPSLISFSL